ncbi:Beta-D-glucosyl crocetin beta-1,6-glucosyltransferase [Capsicum annuum]|uniref:beta-D-glucosyl crocetin beta-1,6-glucosyltransferase n=1 Tax=Capsicum annuum TaxID=4072 RepID=UPI001FB11A6D|nr:beta-D-glucosyl crocetin beta-1,6-glucosyltransferase [Capsicum annuum]XP_016550346.2 beta-D-glucosyl crocetin beta-1,6-glucosyltransferase [Capsicum annuum]XP_047256784.1 beta-D-glucosyl crocetin beta-1,6-glucosyltransferase [Capsicum annuum]KAF3677721.1 Beta-D-glucosyl crocetin beta-1,6-glucosyltransferase [Capsicum annuum]
MGTLRVLMFPFLAYGHISPYLNVAKKLADRGFLIYFCSTAINLKYTIKKIPEKYSDSIQLVELHLPELPELPPHYHTTNGLPPHLNHTLQKALKMSKPNFAKILRSLKPDLVIYDVLQQWAESVANDQNIPAVKMLTSGAAVISYFFNLRKKPGVEFPYPAIYLTKIEQVKVGELLAKADKEKEPDDVDPFADGNMQIMLMSTSRVLEAKYIDFFTELGHWKVVPVGPPVQDPIIDEVDDVELIDWLGMKDESSTVFVSFGSEYFLSKEDMEEIAFGLENSNVNFIWVARFPKGEEQNLEDVLPKGFLERIGDRGRVLNKFAPQPRILNHPSTGGFISHCGWNSIMESMDFGVPIIAIPMHLDQPMNARLMVELGVAIEIVRDDDGKFHRGEIAETLKDVITRKRGEILRAKVRDISKNLKSVRDEEADVVAKELIQLCKDSNKCN